MTSVLLMSVLLTVPAFLSLTALRGACEPRRAAVRVERRR